MLAVNGREPRFTFVGKTAYCLDYVYVSKQIRVVSGVDPAADIDERAADALLSALPNAQHPSDHLPVVVDVEVL